MLCANSNKVVFCVKFTRITQGVNLCCRFFLPPQTWWDVQWILLVIPSFFTSSEGSRCQLDARELKNVKLQQNIRGRPAHGGVFPALPCVELNLPHVRLVRAGLHGILRSLEDAHMALAHVLLRYPSQRRNVLLKQASTSKCRAKWTARDHRSTRVQRSQNVISGASILGTGTKIDLERFLSTLKNCSRLLQLNLWGREQSQPKFSKPSAAWTGIISEHFWTLWLAPPPHAQPQKSSTIFNSTYK